MYYWLSGGELLQKWSTIFLYFICRSSASFGLSLCCEMVGNCWSPTEKNEGTHTLNLNADTFNRLIKVLFLDKCLAWKKKITEKKSTNICMYVFAVPHNCSVVARCTRLLFNWLLATVERVEAKVELWWKDDEIFLPTIRRWHICYGCLPRKSVCPWQQSRKLSKHPLPFNLKSV